MNAFSELYLFSLAEESRVVFKSYVNKLATVKVENVSFVLFNAP